MHLKRQIVYLRGEVPSEIGLNGKDDGRRVVTKFNYEWEEFKFVLGMPF